MAACVHAAMQPEQQQMELQADAKHMCKPGCCGKNCGWVVANRRVSVGPKEGLAQGLKRLADTGTWKQWQWNSNSPVFQTAESFRWVFACTTCTQHVTDGTTMQTIGCSS